MIDVQAIEPLRDGLVVKKEEQQQTTASGIVLPGQAQESSSWGIVLKVGPGKYDQQGKIIPMSVKKGDRVLFGQYAGSKFKCAQQEYLLLKEDEVMAVLNQA